MLFQSPEFLLYFLPIVFVGFMVLKRFPQLWPCQLFLAVGSLVFYAFWKPVYLPIIIGSILANYCFGLALRKKRSSSLLWLGILVNLTLLFGYKYLDFVLSNILALSGSTYEGFNLLLPLGISFFTFQNITYLVDTYDGLTKRTGLINYFLFVSFFPQLIAGPIVHHSEMMPQFESKKSYDFKLLFLGVFVFCIGLIKKVGIADTFALWVNKGFGNAEALHLFESWAVSLSYTFQLYFDFSGYSDMAIGIGLMFNIRLPENFNSPFKAGSITEFWQRWHMTLTRFINTYLYTTIIRRLSSITFPKILAVTLLTMTIVGLWHGANWTFIVFGFMHGFGLVINQCSKKLRIKMPYILGFLMTFLFVNFSFVVFRADNLGQAWTIIYAMFGGNGIVLDPVIFGRFPMLQEYGVVFGNWFSNVGALDRKFVILTFIILCVVVFGRNTRQIADSINLTWRDAYLFSFAVVLAINTVIATNNPSEFLYFNF